MTYRTGGDELDERIRAASAALAERGRLARRVAHLHNELAEAEARVAELAARLDAERRDVARYATGVWAWLYDLFADGAARVEREEREAVEAALRHDEACALRDRLAAELREVEARAATLEGAAQELLAAREAKQAQLIASGDPRGEELAEVVAALGRADAERAALDEAVRAGELAEAAIARLAETLASARNWGTADLLSDSLLVSWAKREKLDAAHQLAAAAQADLAVFQRELADVGATLDAELGALAEHHRFLDTWFDNLFSDLSVQSRIAGAQETTARVARMVDERLADLRTRVHAVEARRLELERARADRLTPSPG